MKNLKELQPILTAVYCINRTNGQEDEDIRNLIDYVFRQILGCNTNLLLLCCIGKTKETIMPEITQILQRRYELLQKIWNIGRQSENETVYYTSKH